MTLPSINSLWSKSNAINIHQQLTQPINNNIKCFCVYSNQYPTQALYRVQSQLLFQIDIIGKEPINQIDSKSLSSLTLYFQKGLIRIKMLEYISSNYIKIH